MTWLWVAVVVAVLGAAIAIVAGRVGGANLVEVARDRPAAQLRSEPLTDADLAGMRFTQTLRGYAMDEVDDFIERLRGELAARPVPDTIAVPATAPTVPVESFEPPEPPAEPLGAAPLEPAVEAAVEPPGEPAVDKQARA
jgi:DivIVA domain-containing protein